MHIFKNGFMDFPEQDQVPTKHPSVCPSPGKVIIKADETVELFKFSFTSKIIQVSFSGVIFA